MWIVSSTPLHSINVIELQHNLNAMNPNWHILNTIVSYYNPTHNYNSELNSDVNIVVLKEYFYFRQQEVPYIPLWNKTSA